MGLSALLLALCASCALSFIAHAPHDPLIRPSTTCRTARLHKHSKQQHRAANRRISSHRAVPQAKVADNQTQSDQTYRQLAVAELGSQLRGTSIYVVGMMGTGKSTIARKLADGLRLYSFLDTDAIIEQLMEAPISEVFAREGEEAFRIMEARVLGEVHSYVKMVIATGGGLVKDPKNWGKLQTGLVVNLNMPIGDIVARLQKNADEVNKRPLLQGHPDDVVQKLTAIHEDRKHMYEQADVVVDISAEDTVDDVVYNVVTSLQNFIDSNPPKWSQWKENAKEQGITWVN